MHVATRPDTALPAKPFKVDPFRGRNDSTVSMQWMSRPRDQRFISLDDLEQFKRAFWEGSFQSRIESKSIELLAPTPTTAEDLHKLTVGVTVDRGATKEAKEIAPTHWAFQQLAGLAKSPAAFLRELPSPLVVDVLGWRLRHAREVEEVKLYGDDVQLHAATGPDYGRIPDYEVVRAVQQ